MQNIAAPRVDNIGAAARLGVARLDVVVELETLEGIVARQRRRDQSEVAPEGQPAQEPGAERDPLDRAARLIDAAEIAASRIEHP